MTFARLSYILCTAMLTAMSAPAQAGDRELIASAMSAAPEAVAQDATVIAVNPKGEVRTLRQGTNNFTCLPSDPNTPANDPMCLDKNGLEWAKAWMSKTEPPKEKIGFGYMLQGGGTPSNLEPHPDLSSHTDGNFLEEPPHVMIFNHRRAMAGYPDPGKNPDTSQPWVMWSGTPYEHLMIPVQ